MWNWRRQGDLTALVSQEREAAENEKFNRACKKTLESRAQKGSFTQEGCLPLTLY